MRERESSLQQFGEFLPRHYSYRTECSHADWVRRLLAYAAEQQGTPRPRVNSELVRDFLTHLAVKQGVSASTQNQAVSVALFVCREVLGIALDGLVTTARAKRGTHRPVVLANVETTMVYTHVVKNLRSPARSPLDSLHWSRQR